ncbi:MAG: rRNA maturation RNase YbeY [Bacteroidota bacterium]
MPIQFTTDDIDFTLSDSSQTTTWISKIIHSHHVAIQEIVYIFCSDKRLLEINRESLSHDYYTDIITFPFQNDPIHTDIFISVDRVRDNASAFGVSFDDELRRVMIHGILHILGYKDHTEVEKEEMRTKENWALSIFQ